MKKDLCERTFRFAVRIVRLARRLDKDPGVSQALARQVLRAGTSIGANVEEAQGGAEPGGFPLEVLHRL